MDYDVVIIGACLSGIGTACHLVRECPGRSVGILVRFRRIFPTKYATRFRLISYLLPRWQDAVLRALS